jgi:hypothetical protein
MSTMVMATGQMGVWRCTQLDFITMDETVLEDIASEEEPFQPELHDFFVSEVSKGIAMSLDNRYTSAHMHFLSQVLLPT